MLKRILSLLLVCAVMVPAVAQKELKPLRTLVKAKKTADAMKEVERLEADSICQFMPELYELAVKTQIQINDVENEKVYLKKACDTVKLFESTRQIFKYTLKGDSVAYALRIYMGKKPVLDATKVKILRRYYKNLVAGTNYFYSRKNYKEAQKNLDVLLSLPNSPLWKAAHVDTLDSEFASYAYMYTYSAFQSGDYAAVERFKSLLLSNEKYYETSLEMYARTANDVGNSEAFEHYLEMGTASFPLHEYFFDELATLYVSDQRYSQCVALANQGLLADSTSLKAMYLKAYALYQMEEEEPCIEVAKQLVAVDTAQQYVDANYYVGQFTMNKLQTIYLPTRIGSKAFELAKQDMKNICEEARPYLERYRKLRPSQHEKWAPLLYRIYLELNMGPEFEDVSRYVQ